MVATGALGRSALALAAAFAFAFGGGFTTGRAFVSFGFCPRCRFGLGGIFYRLLGRGRRRSGCYWNRWHRCLRHGRGIRMHIRYGGDRNGGRCGWFCLGWFRGNAPNPLHGGGWFGGFGGGRRFGGLVHNGKRNGVRRCRGTPESNQVIWRMASNKGFKNCRCRLCFRGLSGWKCWSCHPCLSTKDRNPGSMHWCRPPGDR